MLMRSRKCLLVAFARGEVLIRFVEAPVGAAGTQFRRGTGGPSGTAERGMTYSVASTLKEVRHKYARPGPQGWRWRWCLVSSPIPTTAVRPQSPRGAGRVMFGA